MQTITTIQLDIQQPEFIVVVHAMQQDEKTRYIAISMTEAGVAFTPPSGTLGVLAIRKPDGETCFYDSSNGEPAVTIEGSTATCMLVPEALQVAGDATAALVLYNAQGERLSTFRFLLRIDPTPVPDETVMSSSYYSILTQQIEQALTAAEVAQQVLDMTVSATTLAAGSQATVTKTTSGGVVNLAFGIPQGEAGAAGKAATVSVGTVTTLPAGSDATVKNSGTPGAAVIDFGIPQGDKGDPGSIGTEAGRVVCTGEGGVLEALDAEEAAALLGVNGKAPLVHAARHASGGADAVTPSAIGAVASVEKGAAGGVATLNADGKVTAEQAASTPVSFADVSRSLTIADAGRLLITRNQSDYSQASYTIHIPSNAEVPLPIGMEVEIMRYYPGTVTITAADNIHLYHIGKGQDDLGGSITIPNRYGVVALKKIFADYWIATGDIG